MRLILAVAQKKAAGEMKNILTQNNHKIEAVCTRTQDVIGYAEVLRPDLVIMDIDLPGKFTTNEITKHFNTVFDLPVVYLISNTVGDRLNEALEINPYGLITDPEDRRQLNYTLELVYNKFEESLRLL